MVCLEITELIERIDFTIIVRSAQRGALREINVDTLV